MNSIVIVGLSRWSETVAGNFIAPAIKEKWPQCRVTVVLDHSLKDWSSSLAFDDFIFVSNEHLKNPRGLKGLVHKMALILKLRLKKFDGGIALNAQWSSILATARVKKIASLPD